MNGKAIALLLILLFLGFAFSTPTAPTPDTPASASYPPPPMSIGDGKRLGLWLQWLSELQSVSVNQFVQTYFFTEPYFASLELIYAVWHPTVDNFISWVNEVAAQVDDYPVEIYVMLALDMGNQEHWNQIEYALIQWQDNPSIYSVGVNGEHSFLHYPDHYDYAGFMRFRDLAQLYEKQFLCYYSQNAPSDSVKRDFQWISHVNWPYLGHRVSLEPSFDAGTWQVGISAGLYDHNPRGYPDPNTPHADPEHTEIDWVGYNRASIQYMLAVGFTHDHAERRCLIMAQVGLWNHAGFRQDVQEVSEVGGYAIITSVSTH